MRVAGAGLQRRVCWPLWWWDWGCTPPVAVPANVVVLAWCTRVVIAELGFFMHACEEEMVIKSTNEKVPYFNAPVYLQNKTQIGKVDEIFGPINNVVRQGIGAVVVLRRRVCARRSRARRASRAASSCCSE